LKEILLILGNEGRVSGMDRIVRGVMIGRRAWPVVCVGLMNGEQGQSEWSWVAGHWAMQYTPQTLRHPPTCHSFIRSALEEEKQGRNIYLHMY